MYHYSCKNQLSLSHDDSLELKVASLTAIALLILESVPINQQTGLAIYFAAASNFLPYLGQATAIV